MADNEIIKALECCANNTNDSVCYENKCPLFGQKCIDILSKNALDLINRQKAEIERLKTVKKHIDTVIHRDCEYVSNESYNEAFQKALARLYDNTNAKSEAIKEFAEKIDELLKRYSHLHKRADEARRSTEEYADGTPMEMVSVWEVLSLKKWEMADYENMNALQDNIETIAIERLLTEIEKDFKLLEKEMTADK